MVAAVSSCVRGILSRRGPTDAEILARELAGKVTDRAGVFDIGRRLWGSERNWRARLQRALVSIENDRARFGLRALADERGGFWIGGEDLGEILARREVASRAGQTFDRLFGPGSRRVNGQGKGRRNGRGKVRGAL